jgi:hypothetical protein
MKNRFSFLAVACLTVQLAIAQSAPTRSFMIGPTLGIDQMGYANPAGYVGDLSTYSSPATATFGIDASYQINRLLFGVKALYKQLPFQHILAAPGSVAQPQPRFDRELRVINVPISLGYQIKSQAQFDWYIGVNLAADYLLSVANETLFDGSNTLPVRNPDKSELGRPLNIGYGAQTTLRYQLTPVVTLQIEPTLRYYPRGGFPTVTHNNYQFQGLFSALFKL